MTIEHCIDNCEEMAFKLKNNGRLYLINDEIDTLNYAISILKKVNTPIKQTK